MEKTGSFSPSNVTEGQLSNSVWLESLKAAEVHDGGALCNKPESEINPQLPGDKRIHL